MTTPPPEPDTDGGWRGMMVYVGMPPGMETSGWDEQLRTVTILAEVAKGWRWV